MEKRKQAFLIQVSPNGIKIVIQLLFPKVFIVKGFVCFLLGQNVYVSMAINPSSTRVFFYSQ